MVRISATKFNQRLTEVHLEYLRIQFPGSTSSWSECLQPSYLHYSYTPQTLWSPIFETTYRKLFGRHFSKPHSIFNINWQFILNKIHVCKIHCSSRFQENFEWKIGRHLGKANHSKPAARNCERFTFSFLLRFHIYSHIVHKLTIAHIFSDSYSSSHNRNTTTLWTNP